MRTQGDTDVSTTVILRFKMLTDVDFIVVSAVVIGLEGINKVVFVVEVLAGALRDRSPGIAAEMNANSLEPIMTASEFTSPSASNESLLLFWPLVI